AGIIYIFDAATGKLLERRPLGDRRERSATILSGSLSADGAVATVMDISNGNYRITVWHLAKGQRLIQLGSVTTSTYSLPPDARSLATIEFMPALVRDILPVYDRELC